MHYIYKYQPHNVVIGITRNMSPETIREIVLNNLPTIDQLEELFIIDIGVFRGNDYLATLWPLVIRPAVTFKFERVSKFDAADDIRIDITKRHPISAIKYHTDHDYFNSCASNYDEIKAEITNTIVSAIEYALLQIKLSDERV